MLLAYARASTTHQDVERQIAALLDAGIDRDNIWVDTKTGANTHRAGLTGVLQSQRLRWWSDTVREDFLDAAHQAMKAEGAVPFPAPTDRTRIAR